MENLYNTLGINENASPEEIKSAYEDKAKENHPDKDGGSHEKMQAVNKAYKILSDPQKRDRYDKTGNSEEGASFDDKFHSLVNQVLMSMIDKAQDIRRYNIVSHFNNYINENIASIKKAKHDTQKEIKKLEEVKKRIKSKKDKTFITIIDQHIHDKKKYMNIADIDIEFLTKAKEVISEYQYDTSVSEKEGLENALLTNFNYQL